MTGYAPHPDDVTLGVEAVMEAWRRDRPRTVRQDVEAILAAVLPAHDRRVRAEALREAAAKLRDDDGFWRQDVHDAAAAAIRRYPFVDAPQWLGASAALGVVEEVLFGACADAEEGKRRVPTFTEDDWHNAATLDQAEEARLIRKEAAEWWITELRKIHVRRDDDPYILGPTCRRCNQSWPCATEAFVRRRANDEEDNDG